MAGKEAEQQAAQIHGAVIQIIRQLQNTPSIKESQLKELFRKYATRNAEKIPEKFNPATFECWELIIFRGSFQKAKKNGIKQTHLSRIEDTLRYLKLLPADIVMGENTWPKYLSEILGHLKKQPSKPQDDQQDRNPEKVKAALSLLLGMNSRHYSVNDALVGEYFGYRRSSTRGRIVRFYIKIDPSEGTGLLSFTNHYFQEPDHWLVKGCGFKVDDLTYLVGQAHPADDESTSLGLRYFVLEKFRRLGWFVGLLNSMDKHGRPIASRIALIPAAQHKPVRRNDGVMLSQDEVLQFISSKNLAADDLDSQIEVPRPADLNGLPVSILIQSLIWNGTLRTLHGARAEIPDKARRKEYEDVFAFQRKALESKLSPTNDIDFFARLLAYDDVREAVMSKLPLP
ncbi:hypothetical protein Q3C01_28100 [Bradyrhizobium sp. UFLA05-109]